MSNLAEKIIPISMEESIRENMQAVIASAKAIVIQDEVSYQSAAATLKLISERKKQVQEYWKKPKEAASKAHKEICAKEKDMLIPLTEVESTLKKSIGDYTLLIETQRKAESVQVEQKKQEERDRLLSEAIAAEQSGNVISAEANLLMAEMVEDMNISPVVLAAPKADGISVRKTWKARIINDAQVPTHIAGVCIRPVDLSALNNLARTTKGTIQIPGVEFYEEANLAVR